MNNNVRLSAVFAIIFICIGCRNTFQKIIQPDAYILETDSNNLGTWRVAEDADKHNFVIIQSKHDLFTNLDKHKYNHHYTADELSAFKKNGSDTQYINGLLSLLNDTDLRKRNYESEFKQFNELKDNYNFMSDFIHNVFCFYESRINNNIIININGGFFNGSSITVKSENIDSPIYGDRSKDKYLALTHLRILYESPTNDTFIAAVVTDSALRTVKDSVAFCKKIKDNFDNPSFYSDTLHFYRVNSYHSNLDSAYIKADTSWHLGAGYIKQLYRNN